MAGMSEMGGRRAVGLMSLACLVFACGGTDDENADQANTPKAPPTGPFALSDYYFPRPFLTETGAEQVRITSGQTCKARPENARGRCFRVEAAAETSYGFVFEYPGFDFGNGPGLTLPASVTKLHFMAAGEARQVGNRISLVVGWSAGDVPYLEEQISQTGSFALTADWQAFEIPLTKSGAMVGNALGSQALGPAMFYLDDLYFE